MAEKKQKIDPRMVHEGPHKYIKAIFRTGTIVYRCGLTNCPHSLPEPFIVGKLSICWRCNSIFIITKKSTTSKKLHCEGCTRGKYNKPKEKSQIMESDIDELLGGHKQ